MASRGVARASRALLIALFVFFSASSAALAQERGSVPLAKRLRASLAFAASFDRGLDADFARGDPRLLFAPAWAPPRLGQPGLPPSGAVTHETSAGVRGGSLRFQRATSELVFFDGRRNAPWRANDWSGTISFWLRTDLQDELREGFCDPIQVTPREWNDACHFVEFEKRESFLHFRLAAYADHAVWNPTNKPWEQLSFEEKSLANVERPPFAPDRFTHVAIVFERFNTGEPDGIASLYLDGEPAAELSARTQTFTWKLDDVRIMLGLNYVGSLDELALFDRALTPEEVRELHALPEGIAAIAAAARERVLVPVGAAKVDVTPHHPIRLCGYAARGTEAESAAQRLFVRALAIGGGTQAVRASKAATNDSGAADPESLALLMSVDNCAVPAYLVEEVAGRLAAKRGLRRERFTLCSTHTHTAPCLEGAIDFLFGKKLPDDQLERIHRYTRWLVDRIEEAALAAIDARAPAMLSWAEGRAHFARNRRTAGGPVDLALPVIAARAPDGSVRALVQNYACHCTTCGPAINQHCGDWAGYASEYLEEAQPGAVALTIIGCGADANPAPGVTSRLQDSMDHGRAIANEVVRLLSSEMTPLLPFGGAPECKLARLELPYDRLPTREQFAERAQRTDAVGYHAQQWLARLDRGEPLPTTLPYVVQSWTFGDELAQVFLAGEVVVDYALRLKREVDRSRLWVTAYANDVPCYIPSRRILAEGGYEAEGAMTYYGRPARLAPEVEDAIVGAVRELVPTRFASHEQQVRFPPPRSPAESLASLRLSRDDLDVELVASEPAVQSPVAIDFAADGTVWVCEMNDYPSGMDGKYQPGGRITWLRDRDGDGTFESHGVLLEGLPFPTGVMAWRSGVLVCAAPDLLYAEDTDGDGRADVKKVLFTGFSTENYQARLNSPTWGLDGWVYVACGLFGGAIRRGDGQGGEIDLRGRDFRFDPDTLAIEPVEGTSQQGRVRDDFGRWFGCDSGWLGFQLPLPDRYVRRNPYVVAPSPRWNLLADEDPRRLFQISAPLERFNDPGDASRVTSACGIGIYRDALLGETLYGDLFSCEPVANVVRRVLIDRERGAIPLRGRRAPEEKFCEFLASTDPWFRPVQATTGPDGALWIVDMHRFVIEHPRWIPAARLAELDVRAGADRGRIYRVVRKGEPLRPVRDLTKCDAFELEALLSSPNGVVRDLAHRELLARPREPRDDDASLEDKIRRILDTKVRQQKELAKLGKPAQVLLPAIEVQTAYALEQLGRPVDLVQMLAAALPASARVHLLILAERHLDEDPRLAEFLATAALYGEAHPHAQPDPLLAYQAALSFGEWHAPRAGTILGELLVKHLDDPWIRAAVLSSAVPHCDAILEALLKADRTKSGWSEAIDAMLRTAIGGADLRRLVEVLALLAPFTELEAGEPWRWRALGELLRELERRRAADEAISLREPRLLSAIGRCTPARAEASRALDESVARISRGQPIDVDRTLAALALDPLPDEGVGEVHFAIGAHLGLASALIEPRAPQEVQQAAIDAIARSEGHVPSVLLPRLIAGTPASRALILGALLRRPEWTSELLVALESGKVPKSAIDAAHRDRLLHHADESLKSRATALLAPAGTPRRAQILEQLRPALDLHGDPSRGREPFRRLCASCHAFRGEGHALAPELAALGDRSGPRLLESIIDPNAAVSADFVSCDVELANGDSLSGLIRDESSTGFTIVQANDVRHAVLRRDVKAVRPSKLSVMPEGLEEGLSLQELADLIAWLQSGPAALGAIPAEKANAARDEVLRERWNGYSRLLAAFDVFSQPTWFGVCTMHYCRQTDGTSKVTWRTEPAPAALDGGDVVFRFPAAIGFLSQPDGEFTLALDGRPLLTFDVAIDDFHVVAKDGHSRLDFECRAANAEDATGVMTLTLPASLLRPGAPAELAVTGSAANSLRWFGVLAPKE